VTFREHTTVPPLSSQSARAMRSIATALNQASAEFGGNPKLRHLHMLVQAGLQDVRIAPMAGGYRIESWESMEVRRFGNGLSGYGMLHDSVRMELTDKGSAALDRILSALDA
jgi:hypothetical protein